MRFVQLLRHWLTPQNLPAAATSPCDGLPDDIVDLMHRNETLTTAFAGAVCALPGRPLHPTLGISAAQILKELSN